jgi:hypothetical protein
MFLAMRSVLFTLCLLGAFVYAFAICFRQLTDDLPIGDKHFHSVPEAMFTLLLRGTLPDQADFIYDLYDENPLFAMVMLTFILFASLTVMNMLVGVLVEVVSVVSAVEKEQLGVNFVKSQLRTVLEHTDNADSAGTVSLSKADFTDLLGKPQAARALTEAGVDVLGLLDIADFLFKDNRRLSFPDFCEMVLELRGSNTATVKHIVDLQRFVHLELRQAQDDIKKYVIRTIEMAATSFGEATPGMALCG